MTHYKMEDLHELKGMVLAQVVAWFETHGGSLDDDLYVGSYYGGEVSVIEFEHDLRLIGINQIVGTESQDSVLFVCIGCNA